MKQNLLLPTLLLPVLLLAACTPSTSQAPKAAAEAPPAEPITEQQINAAQQAWCDGLILISQTNRDGGDVKAVAEKVLADNYAFSEGIVLFKPTLAFGDDTFRTDHEGALAYFIGNNPKFPNDSGFALKPWVSARFENAGTIIENEVAISMGNVWIKNESGDEVMVDKTFVFRRSPDGRLRLIVHKSSLPFDPKS
jgi:hypothetical protein